MLRNKLDPRVNAEEGASIRAVRRIYARFADIPYQDAPEPKTIFDIGTGRSQGNREAAIEAFRAMGEVAGDVVAQAQVLVDGLVVVGGGVAGAAPLFFPALVDAVNDVFEGNGVARICGRAYNLEDPASREKFLKGETREVTVPGSGRKIRYDAEKRTAIGLSRLGTSEAVTVGAYAYALSRLG